MVLPAWFAATTMVPAPVTVRVLPVIVPGPETTPKVTAFPEAPPVAVSAIGETPYVTGEDGVKLMLCDAWVIVKFADTAVAAK